MYATSRIKDVSSVFEEVTYRLPALRSSKDNQRSIFSFVEKAAAITIAVGIAFASPAFAASGGGSSGSGTGTPGCPSGEVWNKPQGQMRQRTPVQPRRQATLHARSRPGARRPLPPRRWTALEAVKNQKDAMVLTMIGYSKRKLGNYDQGVALYQQALAIGPQQRQHPRISRRSVCRKRAELDLAKAELVKVAAACGTTCEQYQDLAKAIAGKSGQS